MYKNRSLLSQYGVRLHETDKELNECLLQPDVLLKDKLLYFGKLTHTHTHTLLLFDVDGLVDLQLHIIFILLRLISKQEYDTRE